MKSRREIKASARGAMRDQRGISIILYLLLMAVSLVLGMFQIIPLLGIGVGLVSIAVSALAGVALSGGYTRIYRRIPTDIDAVFNNLKLNPKRKLAGGLRALLFVSLWSIPFSLVFGAGISLTIMGLPSFDSSTDSLFMLPGLEFLYSPASPAHTQSGLDFAYHTDLLAVGAVLILVSAVLIIPVVIKTTSYSLAYPLLAEYPEIRARDALKLSMRMTKGHIWRLIVMNLSFIGWNLLSGLTCGILGIVFVMPYMELTVAGYYTELRDLALRNGLVTPEELGKSVFDDVKEVSQWTQTKSETL